ncbi:MAG: hypothetical protein HY269_05665 [Deltaproteobacteria bacterium]|nr:hypothetical protein [Deltaproteobacteria bacterium]
MLAGLAHAQAPTPKIEKPHLQAALKVVGDLQKEHPTQRYTRSHLTLARKVKFGMHALAGTKAPVNLGKASVEHNRTLRIVPHHFLKDVALPERFDVTQRIGPFPIQDQGECGCCWIFGAVASYEANFLYRKAGPAVNAAEQQLLNCIRTRDSDGCNGGWPADALKHLADAGTRDRRDPRMLYRGREAPCDRSPPFAYKAVSFGYVDPRDDEFHIPAEEDLKRAIYQYGAITVAVNATDEFISYNSGEFDRDEGGDINHAVALVGWKTVKGKKGSETFWRLRNSWGTSWGEHGYMWIKANVNRVGFGALWVTASAKGMDPPVDPPCPPAPVAPNYNAEIRNRIDAWLPFEFGKFRISPSASVLSGTKKRDRE